MIEYRLKIGVREDLVDSFVRFMNEVHIPDLLKTGCFVRHEFNSTSVGEYVAVYFLVDRKRLEQYLEDFAPALRDDFIKYFPDGISIKREIVE